MTTASPRQKPSLRAPGLHGAVLVTAVVALASAGAAGLLAGRPQVLGAVLGAALVGGFFLFGTLNTALATAYAPRLAMVVALLTYTLQVVLLALVLLALTRSGATDRAVDVRWLAGTVIAGTLGWVLALVGHTLRTVPGSDDGGPVATAQEAVEVTSSGEVRG